MKIPDGFRFSGVACGIKESGSSDLAMIVADAPCTSAGVYTTNLVRAASIDWNRNITPRGDVRAVVVNSGNANACTGGQGIEDNRKMAAAVAEKIGADENRILVLSTGVIGHRMPMDKIATGIDQAIRRIEKEETAFESAADAILTTDRGRKTAFGSVDIRGRPVHLAGMCKGAGMIGPRMATMLSVIVTDAGLDPQTAQSILAGAVDASFNRISVEGHMSTNDAVILMCSGRAVALETAEQQTAFSKQLESLCIELAKQIPDDGEGATHLIEVRVLGCESDQNADRIARGIAASNLVKTAVHGADPNWGRIVSAAGYSCPGNPDPSGFSLRINGTTVYDSGQPADYDESAVSQSMRENREVLIEMIIGSGPGNAVHWTSDLTGDYVHFNSAYHT